MREPVEPVPEGLATMAAGGAFRAVTGVGGVLATYGTVPSRRRRGVLGLGEDGVIEETDESEA